MRPLEFSLKNVQRPQQVGEYHSLLAGERDSINDLGDPFDLHALTSLWIEITYRSQLVDEPEKASGLTGRHRFFQRPPIRTLLCRQQLQRLLRVEHGWEFVQYF